MIVQTKYRLADAIDQKCVSFNLHVVSKICIQDLLSVSVRSGICIQLLLSVKICMQDLHVVFQDLHSRFAFGKMLHSISVEELHSRFALGKCSFRNLHSIFALGKDLHSIFACCVQDVHSTFAFNICSR